MPKARKIAVTGATGRLGRHIVDVLEAKGHDVVSISRSTGVDVITGEGLAQALSGVESVIDSATQPTPDQDAATEFFTTAARNIQEVGERAGVQRIVVVSIVGTDRFSGGFLVAKYAHEQAMLAGSIPVQILRATQFHEFVQQMVEWGTQGDVVYVPKTRTAARGGQERRRSPRRHGQRRGARAAIERRSHPRDRRPAGGDSGRDGEVPRLPAGRAHAGRGGHEPGRPGPRAPRERGASPRVRTRPSPGPRSTSGSAPRAEAARLSPPGAAVRRQDETETFKEYR